MLLSHSICLLFSPELPLLSISTIPPPPPPTNQHVSIRPDIDNNPIIFPLSRFPPPPPPPTLAPLAPPSHLLTLHNQCTYVFTETFRNIRNNFFKLRTNSQFSTNSALFQAAIVFCKRASNCFYAEFSAKRYGERK